MQPGDRWRDYRPPSMRSRFARDARHASVFPMPRRSTAARHAAAAVYLKHHPNDYETVRRFLGHRNIRTTVKFYCGLETIQATRMLGDVVRHFELTKLLDCNLFGVGAHDQVHFVSGRVDLIQQALKINRPAGASCANHQFHGAKDYT